ncbi:uncharacterized protein [Eurosta solidaginis]|uniref:uncharacterized protein isoform X1 n=1 Tax=Eurosta solidaginis TaxID=178769 RepID=UPI003530C238
MTAALYASDLFRLDHNEFINYLPHLVLEELLMTQIKINGSWNFLFRASLNKQSQISSLLCLACNESLGLKVVDDHLKSVSHERALKKVERLYHPYYTPSKECGRNTEPETISDQDQTAISKSKYICENRDNSNLIPCNAVSAQNVLTQEVSEPEDMLIDVKLPLKQLLNIEFSAEKGKWMRMITVNKTATTKFYCALCSKFCFGIITVDNHLRGLAHKRAQLACLGVRCLNYKYLNKNCIYGHGESFLINIKNKTTKHIMDHLLYKPDISSALINTVDVNKTDRVQVKYSESMLKRNTKISNKVKLIKKEIQIKNKNVEGLIGVEYVVKIMKTTTDKCPIYECSLCEIILNQNRMQGHLSGYNHRLKYCELHYPNTIEKFKDMIGHVKYTDYFNAMSYILSKLASAIEQHHGRSTPYVVLSSIFSKMRTDVIAHIYSYPNACQQYGPSFTHVVSNEEIKKITSNHIDYVAQNNNYARFAENTDGKLYLNQKCYDPNKRNIDSFDIRKRKRSHSPITSQTRCQSPKKIKDPFQLVYNKPNVPSFYRDKIAVASSEIERIYKEYRKNPESHPLYDEEWNLFWRRRKEQLISQGIDHRLYDYQPDWVRYFRCRLEELFEKEIKESKMEVLGGLSEYNLSNLPKAEKGYHPSPDKGFHSTSSYLDDISHRTQLDYLSNTNNMADRKPTLVHVLRLLTALEDYLGSLGIKIMDLLSKALMIEKNCSNNYELEQQILSFDNCTLLETAVEKLKGILFAGLLDNTKQQGFTRVIKFTTELLEYADKMGWRCLQIEVDSKASPTLKKLAEAVQITNTYQTNEKSLSETLRDLLYMQKNYSQGAFNGSRNQTTYNKSHRSIQSSGEGQYCLEVDEGDAYCQTF